MSFDLHRLVCLLLVLGSCLLAEAQATAKLEAAALPGSSSGSSLPESGNMENVPRVPGVGALLHGINAGITYSQVHDSSIGWYNVITPAVSFTFSPHYSADLSLSIYPYRLSVNPDPGPPPGSGPPPPDQDPPVRELVAERGDAGDTLIGFHARFNPRQMWNTTTASLTLPTGKRSAGLSTGKVTFDFSDHMERYFKQTGLLVDLGVGNSSSLFNSLVTKDYSSFGPLAHFQAGAVVWISQRNYIQSVAYEQLPLGGQTVYTIMGPPGAPDLTVITGNSASEDNGFTTSTGIPLTDHLSLLGYYNRSLRHRQDTVSFGVTYVLRGTKGPKRQSLIDKALREAEAASR